MPTLLDQYGKPIKKEVLMHVFNQGPLSYGLGRAWFSGYLGSYINPDQLQISHYQEMYDYDDACSSGIDFVTLSVLNRLGDYSHPDKTINDAVNAWLKQKEGSLSDDIEEMVRESLKCGFISGEYVFTFNGGKIYIDDIQFLDPAWTEFELWTEGEYRNQIKSVRLNGILLTNTDVQEPIPLDKFLIFSNGGRYGNPYGRSRLKSAYPMYYFKKGMLTAWAITMQKHGTPTRSFKIDPAAPQTIDLGEGEDISLYDFLNGSLASWTNKTDIVPPPGVELIVHAVAASEKAGFEECINYADKCIYRALLLPGLVAATAENGMRALGDVHYKMYDLGIVRYRNRSADAIINQPIRKFILWNFGEQEIYGEFTFRELDAAEAKMEMEMFASATDKGYLNPDKLEDFKHVRNRIGAPEISDEEFNKMQAEKQAKAEEMQARLDANRQAMEEKQKQPGQPPEKGQPKPDQGQPDEQKPEKQQFSRLNGLNSYFVEI